MKSQFQFAGEFGSIVSYGRINCKNSHSSANCCGCSLPYEHRPFPAGVLFVLWFATVYKGNIIKNLIMDCQSYTKYRPNETTGGIFVSWRRKEELPTGA